MRLALPRVLERVFTQVGLGFWRLSARSSQVDSGLSDAGNGAKEGLSVVDISSDGLFCGVVVAIATPTVSSVTVGACATAAGAS